MSLIIDGTTGIASADNVKAKFGSSNDLQIFHDGNNSFINNTVTGALSIKSDDINLMSSASEIMATFVENGAVNLYYDNSKKVETTSTGIDVSGSISADTQVKVLGSNASSVAFSVGDAGTGWYNAGSNAIALSSNGTPSIHVTSGGNIGIGTNNPTRALHIEGSDFSSSTINLTRTGGGSSNDAGLQFHSAAGANSDHGMGGIWFKNTLDGNAYTLIRARTDDSTGTSGRLDFITSTGVVGNATAPSMTIKSNGNVIVGSTSPTFNADAKIVLRPGGDSYFINNGSTLSLNRTSTDGNIIGFYRDQSGVGGIFSGHGASQIGIGINTTGITFNPATRSLMPADPSSTNPQLDATLDIGFSSVRWRNLYLSGGVYLGGTGTANHLDDYEEGSFTPVLSWYTPSNGSVSYIARTATYVKVGRKVTIHLELRLNVVSQNSATLPLLVSGFPFPFHNTGGYGGSLMQVSLQGFTFSSGHIPFGWGEFNSDRMFLFTMSSNAANNNLATPPNYKTINVSGTYITPT